MALSPHEAADDVSDSERYRHVHAIAGTFDFVSN